MWVLHTSHLMTESGGGADEPRGGTDEGPGGGDGGADAPALPGDEPVDHGHAGGSMHALRDELPVGELSLDEVFALLADRRRRFVLHALHANDPEAGTTDLLRLTERVVARERSADREFEEETGRAAVRRDLDDRVLPQLDEAGLLDYDARSGAVRFYGHPVVEEYLGHVRGLEWPV